MNIDWQEIWHEYEPILVRTGMIIIVAVVGIFVSINARRTTTQIGIVTDKFITQDRSGDPDYYLIVDKKEYETESEVYYSVDKGQRVEIEATSSDWITKID